MRTRPAICRRKARFQTEEEALLAAEKAPMPLRPYRCGLCRRYHLTSRTKGMRLPAFEVARRKARQGQIKAS